MEAIAFSFLGGIGNTLFQAATAISLAVDNKCYAGVIDRRIGYLHTENKVYLNGIFADCYKLTERDIQSSIIIKEQNFNYSPIQLPFTDGYCILNGYFQSEKYFAHNRREIIESFYYSCEKEKYFQKWFPNIGDFVSLHVRRGNYVDLKHIHRNLDKQYYEDAMSLFPNDRFLVFSDDIKYCKGIFKGDRFVFFEEAMLDIDCLHLMSKCKHNIIANSTFSWWAAWLNLNIGRKVVAPKQWFTTETDQLNSRDIVPDNWIKI